MFRHRVVEVEVIDVIHEVLGAWGRHETVPMKFGSHEGGCWGGDWYVKCDFSSTHCESHYVRLFLLGTNVAENTAICDLGTLGDFLTVDETKCVSYMYVP